MKQFLLTVAGVFVGLMLFVVVVPALLIARGEKIRFFGPVTPHAQTARQLVRRALHGELATEVDPALAGLPARLRALR